MKKLTTTEKLTITEKLIYSIRNLLYHRYPRQVTNTTINGKNIHEIKDRITEVLLNSAGLSLEGHELDGIYLTAYQHSTVRDVQQYNYAPRIK